MKIAIVAGTFPEYSETFVQNHITGLLSAGHEVRVFATHFPDENASQDFYQYGLGSLIQKPYLPRLRGRLTHLPGKLWEIGIKNSIQCLNVWHYAFSPLLFKAPYVITEMKSQRFDIIHSHFGQNGLAICCLRNSINIPQVTSFHGDDMTLFGRWSRLVYNKLFLTGDCFVANSAYTRSQLEQIGCRGDKIRVIPAVINDDGILPATIFSKPDRIRIITVARLVEEKGIQFCLHAIRLLLDLGYNVEYLVVGDGPYLEELTNLAKSLNIFPAVRFAGRMSHESVYKEYRQADIFVLPSIKSKSGWEETQGVTIQEAQLHCVPVVASRYGGIPEGVNYGQAGLLFEPGNSTELAKQLQILIDKQDFAKEIAESGKAYCRKKYSKRASINSLLNLYSSLTASREESR